MTDHSVEQRSPEPAAPRRASMAHGHAATDMTVAETTEVAGPVASGPTTAWPHDATLGATRIRRAERAVLAADTPRVRRRPIVRSAVPVIRRYVVPQATIPGMTADLDTTQLDQAKGLIDQLFNEGKRASLVTLFGEITDHDQDNKALFAHLSKYLNAKTTEEPASKPSGFTEKFALSASYFNADTSDVGVRDGLRMWVSGDPKKGLGWKVICNHLRGVLTADEYILIGTMHFLAEDQRNKTALEPGKTDPERTHEATTLLNAAAGSITGALNALPAHDNVSYRQSGVASATTYGSTIVVGDVIRDAAFWSTSALRSDGSAGKWGSNGTVDKPKVYFLISGSTGKYISKYAAQEEGQHEVLFGAGICFRVDRIANYGNHTLFVEISEVPAVAANTAKNPYNGTPA